MQTSPDVVLARQEAYDALVSFARSFREGVAFRRALAGNGMGTLDVPGANRRIFVELGGAGGDVAEALWDAFKPALGAGVFVTRPRIFGAAGWLVVGQTGAGDLPCYPSGSLA